ncbi:MAG TPA: DEDDh family exonuclease [Mycobacterium sp.]|uniref:DEDDh family exonuclease n=1 Tax=Mycolicibacterium sp. TaxID=2320850 RepID=UPI0025DE1E0C|nr:DEDDh family exonuclease [Mycolicibacterium sp.]HPX36618.1 DEDDh family exonuclease [Mycobacterium sp.]HQC76769.1 DEDDh family exonuclease [Mycobacterium sp.]
MSQTWGRPAGDPGEGWVVVDVETSGFSPRNARVLSVAALALDPDGNVENSVVSLVNPGVDPGPTHVHGITTEMLTDQPTFADIAPAVAELVHGRTLVAHNAGFDYSFLTAEAEIAGATLPVDTVMCTVELSRRLDLGLENLRLETLARHWNVPQTRAHDAFDDALVLSRVLMPALERARARDLWLPIRPVGRKLWPNGSVTHDELEPLKRVAARMPCDYLNPGRYRRGGRLVQGMRVALSAEVARTHEELVERILHAGLAYTEAVDAETSLVICNDPQPEHGKGYQARELGVPLVSDEEFMAAVGKVVHGVGVEMFEQSVDQGQQFALF